MGYCSIKEHATLVKYFEYQPDEGGKYPEAFLMGYHGYIHTNAYSRYNEVKGVKQCLCYTHLHRAFVDALPKDVHDPKASKPTEAIQRLNKLFEIEGELEGLSPEQKKKNDSSARKNILRIFGHGQKSSWRVSEIKAFHSLSLCTE